MRVGEQIQLLRERDNITQKELAEHLGIHNSVLNRIELGLRPCRDDELLKLASFFNVSTDYLLGIQSTAALHKILPADPDSQLGKAVHTSREELDVVEGFRNAPAYIKEAMLVLARQHLNKTRSPQPEMGV